MSERSLRGTQLGSRSLESEVGVEPAPRQHIEYRCEDGHTFTVPFSQRYSICWRGAGSTPTSDSRLRDPSCVPLRLRSLM